MKKLFFLIISAILITGCTSTRKTGCEPGKQKTHRGIPKGFLSLILLLLLSITTNAQKGRKARQGEPMNIQVEVDTIFHKTTFNVDLRGYTMADSAGIRDTVLIKWGSTRNNIRAIQKGSWLTIYACKCDPDGKWIMREIRLNR